jgi:hypothetical protein
MGSDVTGSYLGIGMVPGTPGCWRIHHLSSENDPVLRVTVHSPLSISFNEVQELKSLNIPHAGRLDTGTGKPRAPLSVNKPFRAFSPGAGSWYLLELLRNSPSRIRSAGQGNRLSTNPPH